MNYFIETPVRPEVPRFPFSYTLEGKPRKAIHLGASGFGICFNLRVYPKYGINTLDDWKNIIDNPDSKIYDETGQWQKIKHEFCALVVENYYRKTPVDKDVREKCYKDFIDGPNNLLRNPIGKNGCIGHGEGTHDYIVDMIVR